MCETEAHRISLEDIDAQRLREKFKLAESSIKTVEVYHGDLIIPSVNELRYVGFHLSKYLINPEDETQLPKAAFHCERATYDAFETAIDYLSEQFDVFEEEFADLPIGTVVPEIGQHRRSFREIKSFIVNHNHKEERQDHYDACQEHYENLRIIVDELEDGREDLNRLKAQNRKSSKRFQIALIVTLAVGFIGIAASIVIAAAISP